MKPTTVQIRKKGQFTIPVGIREALDINDIEGMFVIPQKLKTQELLEKIAAIAKKRGVTLEEMFAELNEIRHHS